MPKTLQALAVAAALFAAPAAQAEAEAAAETEEPAFWEVIGVDAARPLNLRAGPSTAEAVVAELARGTVLGNLGCTGAGEARWCEVELAGSGLHGWASARYLAPHDEREPSADPAVATAVELVPAGQLACSLAGTPVPTCPYAVRQTEAGTTEIVVTFPDGFERVLGLGDGEIWSPDPTDEVASSPNGGTITVEVNGVERIEIPDAVLPEE